MRLFLVALMTTLVVPAYAENVSKAEKAEIIKALDQLKNAHNKGDFKFLVSRMPAGFFKVFNTTQEKLTKQSAAASAFMKSKGFKVIIKGYGEILGAYRCKKNKVVFVATSLEMDSAKENVKGSTFMVASKQDNAKTWSFADGIGMRSSRKKFDQIYHCAGVKFEFPKIVTTTTKKPKKTSNATATQNKAK